MFDVEDDRAYVKETAIRHRLGTKEEIELYDQISIALELKKCQTTEKFDVVDSSIGNGINFSITTPYPFGLPETVGVMFFNVSTDYDVRIKETSASVYNQERHFEIKIKKC